MTPTVIEYRGDPKRYVSVILGAIDRGRLTYNGDANCEQTFRSLSSVIDVISPKNGKALSIETLVSYEKKENVPESFQIIRKEISNNLFPSLNG